MNNPQLPPVDAPVGKIARHIAELMRLHPNVYAGVTNAVRSLHPLDLRTLEHLQKEFYRFASEAAEEWQGPDYRSGQARAYERISAYLLNAIEMAWGEAVKPQSLPDTKHKIQWDKLEAWANFVAMDQDSQWWQYEEKPKLLQTVWGNSITSLGKRTNLIPFTAPDWRTSLRQRPKTKDQ